MAYISINPNRDAGRDNSFSVNGSDPVRIYTTALHRLPDDEYTVTIRSSNGECWECAGDLSIYRSSSVCMNIRLAVDAAGNIVDVEYAVFPLNIQQEGAYRLGSSKLRLTYTQKASEPQPAPEPVVEEEEVELPEEFYDDEEEEALPDELPEEDEEEEEEAPAPAPDPEPVFDEPESPKKGGAGLIVFGILCLLTAAVNSDKLPTLIGCGVLGIICLLLGIKKKKG